MADNLEPYGARVYAELRKLTGYDLLVSKLTYEAIQRLKGADRDQTVKIFNGSDYEVLQQLHTQEPEVAARFIVEKARGAAGTDAAAAVLIMGSCFMA